MLISIFIMVNRKGALSQIIGVLSFENCIVAFGIFAGLEQSSVLQLGIIFDIGAWLVIATVLVAMVYRHTGSLDVTNLRHLRD
jgi:hydrogenase-4 membrane subunit HyfE